MKPIKYEGAYMYPSVTQPWMLALQSSSTNILYGLAFMSARPSGCACSESFEPVPLDKIADGGYYIDTIAVPSDRVEMLKEHGPVVDTKLPELTVTYLGKDRSFLDMVEAINFPHTLDKFSCCSVDIVANIWAVMGARIGRMSNGKIVWRKRLIYPENNLPN